MSSDGLIDEGFIFTQDNNSFERKSPKPLHYHNCHNFPVFCCAYVYTIHQIRIAYRGKYLLVFFIFEFFYATSQLASSRLVALTTRQKSTFLQREPYLLAKDYTCTKVLIRVRRHRRASECQQTHQPERSYNCSAPFIV